MNNIKKYTQKDRYGAMISYEFDVPAMQGVPKPDEGNSPLSNYTQSFTGMVAPKGSQKSITGKFHSQHTKDEGHPGDARGTDTVPAWLTPGENVVNAEASRLPGNQQKIDQMNDQGRAIQKKQGGPIPSYEADGGQIPQYHATGTDDPMGLGVHFDNIDLDAVQQVESGGNPNLTSSSGAIGPYQIMPSTAQNPGYGVKSISLDDLRDPTLSRDFARRYLQALADRNPTLTKDEIFTAYHSGLGNVLKNKAGEEELGARGQEYAGKIAAAKGGIPVIKTASNEVKYDERSIPSTFMSAQASTMSDSEKKDKALLKGIETEADPDNRIGDPGYIPMPEDPPLSNVDVMNPGFVDKRDEEFFDFKNTTLNTMLNREIEAKTRLENWNALIAEKLKNGEQLTERDVNTKKRLEEDIARNEKAIFSAQNAIDAENKSDIEKQNKINMEFGIIPKPEIDINAETDIKKKKEAQAIVDKLSRDNSYNLVMDEAEITYNTNTSNNQNYSDMLIQKAKGAGKVVLDKSIEFFKEAFSSMFSGPELARMAMIYAGSRVMGYNHGGSLNYSMKNYLKRVDGELAQRKKNAASAEWIKTYKPASLAAYLKSGDMNDLAKKGATIKKPSGSVYVTGEGELPTFTMSDGTDTVFHKGQYKPFTHKDLIGRVDKMNNEVYGDVAVSKRFADYAEAQVKVANANAGLKSGTKDDDTYDTMFKENAMSIGSKANAVYRRVLRSNFISIKRAPRYEMAVQRGIDAYLRDVALAKKNKRKGPTSVEAYIEEQVFVPLSGVGGDQVAKTSTQHLTELNKNIKRGIPGSTDSQAYLEEYKKRWAEKTVAWNQLRINNPKQYQKIKDGVDRRNEIWLEEQSDKTTIIKNWDPFTYWVSITPQKEIDKLVNSA